MPLSGEFNKNAEENAEEWFGLGAAAFPAVPRPTASGDSFNVRGILPLPVGDTEAYRLRQDVVDAALVILSQSPTARKLAATAIAKNYTIVIDPPVISGAGVEHENLALGSTDALNKRINLKSQDDPVALAMVLAHELAHVSQMEKGSMPYSVTPYHPLASIRNLMAMEGDARAHEFIVALELSYLQKGDPDERLIFPQAIDIAAENIGGEMPKRVIAHFKENFPDGVDRADMMARIFKAFYASADLRAHYEATILHSLSTVAAGHPGAWKNEKLFNGDIPVDAIIAAIDGHSIPYLAARKRFVSLESDQMTALWPSTLEKLGAMEKERHENPLARNDRPWTDAPDMEQFIVRTPAAPVPAPAAPKAGFAP